MTRRRKSKALAPTAAPMFATGQTTPTPEEAIANPLQAALQHAAVRRAARPPEDGSPPAPAPKRQRAPGAKFEALFEAASRGDLPPAPDLSAPTHKAFRKRGEKIVAMAEAGDLARLEADTTEPKSSSRVMICRYRDLAIVALAARARQAT